MYIDHSTRLASWASIFSRWLAAASPIEAILMRSASRTCIPKSRNDQCSDDREGDDAHRPHAPSPGLEHPAEAKSSEPRRHVLHAVQHSGGGGRGLLSAEVRRGGAREHAVHAEDPDAGE